MKVHTQLRGSVESAPFGTTINHSPWGPEHTESRRTDAVIEPLHAVRRVLLGLAGVVCVFLGVAGVLLPGLPATPFLLLACWLLSRSYPRLNVLLVQSPVIGPIITDWRQKGGIRRSFKIKAILMVTASIVATLCLSGLAMQWQLVVVLCGMIGLLVVANLPECDD